MIRPLVNHQRKAVVVNQLQLSQLVKARLTAGDPPNGIALDLVADYGVTLAYASQLVDKIAEAGAPAVGQRVTIKVPGNIWDAESNLPTNDVAPVSLAGKQGVVMDDGAGGPIVVTADDGTSIYYESLAQFNLMTAPITDAKRATANDIGAVLLPAVESFLNSIGIVANKAEGFLQFITPSMVNQLIDTLTPIIISKRASIANWWLISANGNDYVIASDRRESAIQTLTGNTAEPKFRDKLDYPLQPAEVKGPFARLADAVQNSKNPTILYSRHHSSIK